MHALILAPFTDSGLALLRQRIDVSYESWLDTRRIYDSEELAGRLAGEHTSILVVEADFVFDEVFERAPTLRLVGVCRNSTDHVGLKEATRHGVLVVNTPGRNARAVAEHALGLMLSLARRIPASNAYVTERRWVNPAEPYISMRGIELAGRTLGVIGLGAIGETLAGIGAALGMDVIGHDPYVERSHGVRMAALDGLLAGSDFISIHAPLTQETEGLIDAQRLALMKPTAYLVNLSAAAIVSQEALVAALREKRIAGAAMDVFESHPVAPDSPLLELDDALLTPHLGGATAETVERHSKMMADDILRFLDGERPRNLVNREAWGANG